jgi:hypothetical protein
LLACLDEAVAYIHWLKPKESAWIVAEIAQMKREGEAFVKIIPGLIHKYRHECFAPTDKLTLQVIDLR